MNAIHLPYKHDPNNVNRIHIYFSKFCTKFCIVKIVKLDFFGVAIMDKYIPFCYRETFNSNAARYT